MSHNAGQDLPDQPPATQLVMIREDLASIPHLELPDGYHARSLRAGTTDEQGWEHIIRESFGLKDISFKKHMEADEPYKPERVLFICDEAGVSAATASAWYRPQWNEDTGYLHMVGIVPEQGGKKLGYYASLAALHQMLREGRTRAVLNTDDFRVAAVKTYLNLGFLPQLDAPDHLERWSKLATLLNRRLIAVDPSGNEVVLDPSESVE
ncbi:GNAT family N-acetyltransferase [Paenibacillus spongiae]|uniref:GNAT family N-acetyltransferase n=1 Tax=Paenibacillus spongiae TaxID=2909671 RepID=A0ABY5SFY5_9BACL|nr:GNAT family N-acetyltransferase [Paenibacillus spongiae]UVI32674.1 GNAT family N-acetyltransferase [Paenibacillus spongiae]